MIKILSKLQIENFLNLIFKNLHKPTSNLITYREKFNIFPLRLGRIQKDLHLTCVFNIMLDVLAN